MSTSAFKDRDRGDGHPQIRTSFPDVRFQPDHAGVPRTPSALDHIRNSTMSQADPAAQLAALKATVLGAVDDWNQRHPQRLQSRKEFASIDIRDKHVGNIVTYSITIACKLVSHDPMAFHGPNLANVAERARLTVERNIESELRRREQKARDDADFVQRWGIAS
jgi:hypothetical protein